MGIKKLISKAVKGICVGIGRTHDSLYLHQPVTGKISLSKIVSCNKIEMFGLRSSFSEDCEFLPEPEISLEFEEDQVESSKPLNSLV